jgi:hypothetical protein
VSRSPEKRPGAACLAAPVLTMEEYPIIDHKVVGGIKHVLSAAIVPATMQTVWRRSDVSVHANSSLARTRIGKPKLDIGTDPLASRCSVVPSAFPTDQQHRAVQHTSLSISSLPWHLTRPCAFLAMSTYRQTNQGCLLSHGSPFRGRFTSSTAPLRPTLLGLSQLMASA